MVDDEPYNLLALQIIIESSGFENIKKLIDCAHNGEQAYEKVK